MDDLLQHLKRAIRNKESNHPVRIEVNRDLPDALKKKLRTFWKIQDEDFFVVDQEFIGPGLNKLYEIDGPDLKDQPFNPRLPSEFVFKRNFFDTIRKKDFLVHHPYESFYTVVEFLNFAAEDPETILIKQTLYRSGERSPIMAALIRAAQNGKDVTVVIELKARFDENHNIEEATRLRKAGVKVVYGFVDLKTHTKMTLVVRKNREKLDYFVHLSSGNYNTETARHYTDLSLFTARPGIGKDAVKLFNLLTGFNIFDSTGKIYPETELPKFDFLVVAPMNLRRKLIEEIDAVITEHEKTRKGRIVFKLNSLVDRQIIEALYRASSAGIEIRLIVRGICCLRPGVEGVSENIEVTSIVDRFLEHSRIYFFQVGETERVYIGSADCMPRNLDRRVETLCLVDEPELRSRLIYEILETYLNDNVKARKLFPDGVYRNATETESGGEPIRSQEFFIELARKEGIKSVPYAQAIRKKTRMHTGLPVVGLIKEADRRKILKDDRE